MTIAQIKIGNKIYSISAKRKVADAKYDAKTGGKQFEETEYIRGTVTK